MSEESEWKRPSQVMKIHRRRKSVTQKRITQDPDKRTNIIYKSPSKPLKRINPFGQNKEEENSAKRQRVDVAVAQKSSSIQLFSVLDNVNKDNASKVLSVSQSENIKKTPKDSIHTDTSPTSDVFRKEKEKSYTEVPRVAQTEVKLSSYIPVDWSLKTKLRVVSSKALQWCTHLKTAEEAIGVSSFVQDKEFQVADVSDQQKVFQRSCMYWTHPNIPWMRTFPRIVDDSKAGINFSYLLQEDVQRSLQADWEQSFTSAYHQLRAGQCPYFYVCTHHFTVLFHLGEPGNQSSMVALVTPTTRGFRESLETEGISFTLPVGNKSSSPDKSSVTSEKTMDKEEDCESTDCNKELENRSEEVDEDLDDILATDDAASGWLESMGLNKKEFPSLDPKRVKLQREGFRMIDHRPESLVCIVGGEVQAFFNFLLNCRTCTPSSGSQAGLPPTILCPTPFQGATLKSHKVKHTVVKQYDKDGHISHAHIVEMSGPIMPHNCQMLMSLYHHTQQADFGMVFNNHDPTVPLNILPQLSQMLPNNTSNNNVHMNDSGSEKYGSPSVDKSVNTRNSFNSKMSPKSDMLGEFDETEMSEGSKSVGQEKITDGQVNNVLSVGKLFKHDSIELDRVCAIKELVSTHEGFSWTT